MAEARNYKRWRVLAAVVVIIGIAGADHFTSPTFLANLGIGGVETVLDQRRGGEACAPCGAPCPSD